MTEPVTTTYVRYLYPGIFFPEESIREVADRNPGRVAHEADPAVFAFEFFDRMRTAVLAGGEEIEMDSGAIGKSGLYYIDAEPMTAADVAALPGDHSILLSNMRGNDWDPVLRCRTGNFRPLEEGDTVISSGAPCLREGEQP